MKKIILLITLIHYVTLQFAHPGTGILQNKKGEIFYTDLSRVWKVSSDGTKKEVVVPAVHTHDLSLDQEGNLYGEHLWYDESLKSKWGFYVWKYGKDGSLTKIIKDTDGFRSDYSFTRDNQDHMYWIEEGKTIHNLVRKSMNGEMEIISSFEARDIRKTYCSPGGMVFYIDDNDLYRIATDGDHTPSLIASDLDGKKGIDPGRKPNNNTMGIWGDESGNVYVAVYNKKSIIKVDPISGMTKNMYTSPVGWAPSGGLIDMDKSLWVMENNMANEVRVKKIKNKLNGKEVGPLNSKPFSIYILGILIITILVAILIGNNIIKGSKALII